MLVQRISPLLAFFAVVCFALTSVASATHMAPAPQLSAEMQAFLETGGSVDDLCAAPDVDHSDHDCPFCRLLSDPEIIAPTLAVWTLIPRTVDLRLADVTSQDQRYRLAVAARGPPLSI